MARRKKAVEPAGTRQAAIHEVGRLDGPFSGAKPEEMRYYSLTRNWRRVEPHLADEGLNDTLVRDFDKFTYGRWRKRFTRGMFPRDFESCDWDLEHRGREPRFWQYVKHAACHWLVNFTLRLAELTLPRQPWRVITSDKHSTVWDGGTTLFDFNFQALGVPAPECFRLAAAGGRERKPGKLCKVYRAEHWRRELRRREQERQERASPEG
jgi:hypothetical protein